MTRRLSFFFFKQKTAYEISACLVVVYGVIELFFGISGRMDGVAHFAHVGGMLWGFLLLYYWKHKGVIRY